MNAEFFITAILLGMGLAMDAFSVSLANGLNAPCCMKLPKMSMIAGIFAGFQALMPLLGWVCIHTVAEKFNAFQKIIPWIALVLLCYIGGKMLWEGIKPSSEEEETDCAGKLTLAAILIQGVATSIDALSVGFTISNYKAIEALVCALLIAVVTFFICMGGLYIGKKFGTKLANKASLLGGVILIGIGLWIFFK